MKHPFGHSPISGPGRRCLRAWAAVLIGAVGSMTAMATTVAPLSFSDTVRQADAIVVGTVTGHESRWGDASRRWMRTDFTLAVEDVVHPSEQGVPIQKTIVLTYWGGTIGDETQSAAGVRLPADGERLVLLLHSRWAQGGTTAPTVGFNHGLFSVESGPSTVRDAEGRPVTLTSDGRMGWGQATAAVGAGAAAVDLFAFTGWLRANVGSIKAGPAPQKAAVDQNDPRVMKTFAKTPALPGPLGPGGASVNVDAVRPAEEAVPGTGGGVPAAGPITNSTISLTPGAVDSRADRPGKRLPSPNYSSSHQAHLPIVINNYPASFAPWSPEDQYQMSKWNYYASDVFRVYTTPTGTYAWGDGVFDLAGWPSDADLTAVYGDTWYCGSGCTVLGVTYSRHDGGGWIIEADIALNPAVTWTVDDEWVFDGGAATGFRQTLIHELGHMHGLNHNFGFLALMNYFQPNVYRHYAIPFMDDAAGIRAEYPSNAVARTDLGVYLFYGYATCFDGTNFFDCVNPATFASSVAAGNSITINNYHVENSGTTTIGVPTINWYLTAQRNFNGAYYSLGQATYAPLAPFNYFTPSGMGVTFNVPASVVPGDYYVAAYIPGDGGPGQSAFPFSNNNGFSRTKVTVTPVCYTLTAGVNPSGVGSVTKNTAQNCSGGYTVGTAVSLTANTPPGYTFSGWVGTGGTFSNRDVNPATFTITGNASVTAMFAIPVADVQLSNGVPYAGSIAGSMNQGSWRYYYMNVPAGATQLTVTVDNLSADVDLYARFGSKPGLSTYACRPFSGSTTAETCTFSSPAAGTWWFGVNNWDTGTVAYRIKATWYGPPTAFYTLPGCRVFDTRNVAPAADSAAPALGPSEARLFSPAGRCGIPASAKALSVNVTTVDATLRGNIAMYPGNETAPTASVINYGAGRARANNGIVKLAPDGSVYVMNRGTGSVNFVLDVNGWFE